MGRTAPHPPALKLYLAINAAALFGAAAMMTVLARSAGFSPLRLLLLTVTSLLALAAAAAVATLNLRPTDARRLTQAVATPSRSLAIALFAAFLLFWCLTWFPPEYTGRARDYYIGLYPLILWALLAAGSALVLFVAARGGSATEWWLQYFRDRRAALLTALIALAAFGLVAVVTRALGILHGLEPFWYGAGVPILAAHVLLAVLVACVAWNFEGWKGTPRLSGDVILFILIWVVAGTFWAAQLVPPSYWVTAPRAPNFEYYPFSDSITYDIASQFALIGQGIFNGMFFDRALYMSFLVYLHTLGGQDYQRLMAIQAALFAVFPALLFLVGKQLHSRTAGVVLAALATARGLVSLGASAWIDTATFKHMLTDFPTAIGVAGYLVLLLRWMQAPRQRAVHLVWAAGALGLTSLLRPHVLLLMGASALVAVWIHRPQWRRGFGLAALCLLAFLAAVLPWMTLGPGPGSGSLLRLYGDRFSDVIAQRYPRPAETAGPASQPTPIATLPAAQPGIESPTSATPIAVPTVAPPRLAPKYRPPVDPGPPFVVDHFLHNLVTAAMIFPDTPRLLLVRAVVKEGQEFWQPRWDGSMHPRAAALLILNLAVVSFGIGTTFQRDRWRGLAPIAVLLLYLAANSLARTSGGRYLVPVDWIVVGYFSVAAAELTRAASLSLVRGSIPALTDSPLPSRERKVVRSGRARGGKPPLSGWRGLAPIPLTILLLLLLGALVPLAGVLYPVRYAAREQAALLKELRSYVPQAGTEAELQAFLQQPDAVMLQGRLLYPLHYRRDVGEPTRYAPYTARPYPRTVFMLIGPGGMRHVLLPGDRPERMPNASDALVLGCLRREQTYLVVHAIAVGLPGQQAGLLRNPVAALGCPQPEPVCDSNGNCY